MRGRLARWSTWSTCDVGEATEGLQNDLWRRWSGGRVVDWAVAYMKRWKGWRMSCDVREAVEGLENELWRRWSNGRAVEWADVGKAAPSHSPTLTSLHYVTAHSPTLPPLCLCHSSFYRPSVASPTSPGEPPVPLWWCLIYPWWFCNLQWLRPAGLYERRKLALELKRLKKEWWTWTLSQTLNYCSSNVCESVHWKYSEWLLGWTFHTSIWMNIVSNI